MYTPIKNYGNSGEIRLLQSKWFNIDFYYKNKSWLEDKRLSTLRPSLENLKGKKDVVGVEVGIGNCLTSRNILDNLDIKKLYLIDRNKPTTKHATEVLNDERVVFLQGDSLNMLKNISEELDFIYLDASHEYNYVIREIEIGLPKLKVGGILGGHDYEQIGVVSAVNTFIINLWKTIKEKPTLYYDSCRDNHPGYPKEYIEYGFPIDWWFIKDEKTPNEIKINHLRNG